MIYHFFYPRSGDAFDLSFRSRCRETSHPERARARTALAILPRNRERIQIGNQFSFLRFSAEPLLRIRATRREGQRQRGRGPASEGKPHLSRCHERDKRARDSTVCRDSVVRLTAGKGKRNTHVRAYVPLNHRESASEFPRPATGGERRSR